MRLILKKFFIGAMLLSTILAPALGYGSKRYRGVVSPAEVVLSVPDMHCVACPTIVRKSLESVQGVIEVEISGINKTARVKYDSAQVITSMLIKATTMAGYPSIVEMGKVSENSSISKVIFDIPNMHCVACPTIVRKSLENLTGVLEVKVSGANKTATVVYNTSQINISTLVKATTMVGYPSEVRRKEQASSLIKKIMLDIPNMHCVACPTIVRKSLENLTGVIEVKISGVNKTATVIYDAHQISPQEMIKATTRAGYPFDIRSKKSR